MMKHYITPNIFYTFSQQHYIFVFWVCEHLQNINFTKLKIIQSFQFIWQRTIHYRQRFHIGKALFIIMLYRKAFLSNSVMAAPHRTTPMSLHHVSLSYLTEHAIKVITRNIVPVTWSWTPTNFKNDDASVTDVFWICFDTNPQENLPRLIVLSINKYFCLIGEYIRTLVWPLTGTDYGFHVT